MDFIWNSITDWLKEVLVSGIVSNLSGLFDSTNEQIGEIAGQVGLTPQAWNSGIFNMIQNLSNNVILPLAGAILAIVMTLELIQLITDRNNLNDVDTWMFFKELLDLFRGNGGLMIGPGCALGAETPSENILALVRATKQFG